MTVQDPISAIGGRKFLAGTILAVAILAAGFMGKIPMLDAVQYAVMVYGAFVGGDAINTYSHKLGDLWGPPPKDPPTGGQP